MLAAARALARAGLPPTPHLDLPVGPTPQDNDNVEAEEQETEVAEVAEPAEVKGEEDEDVEMEEQEEAADGDEEEDSQPLLSIAESLVLAYSLTQTRQYHLTHLLPHVFSHPVIPSYNRPRLRLPPKTGLTDPKPPVPELPLPLDEYHANTGRPEPKASTPGTAEDAKQGKDKSDVPAHEAQCVARVDLCIGPISFPATELWVGKFVHPRATAPRKAPRTKEEKAERDKIRRLQKKMEEETGVRQPVKPLVPRAPIARPAGQPVAGPSRPPARPGAMPVRPGIDPALIQRVNAAAAQHPWLSVIIHKAARNSASKEELSKLARIVARLGKGEGIGEGPNFGLPAAQATVPTARPPSASSLSPAPQGSMGNSESELSSAPSDGSDSEPDMTGPKQVGGGPVPDEPAAAQAGPSMGAAAALSSATPAAASAPIAQPALPPTFRPHSPASFGANALTHGKLPPPPISRPQVAIPPGPTSTQATTPRPLPQYPPSAPKPPSTAAPMPQSSTAPVSAPPPPPPRRYPQPAPFLYIAFRELPTEKYLVPIGSQSYISRLGGDHVTHPAPQPLPKPAPLRVPEPAPLVLTVPTAVDSAPGEVSKRTRQSLGRQKEEKPPTPEPEPEQLPTPPPEILMSNLPPLAGMAPPPGTVLISTFLPTTDWMPPDWKSMSKRLPFENKIYDIIENKPEPPKPEPSSPERRRHLDTKSARPPMLNLGAEAWYPDDDPVHAVTIRMYGIDDRAWFRMKRVIADAEQAGVNNLAEQQPELLGSTPSRDRLSQPRLWESYYALKRSNFESLLTRVPARSFLHYRLAEQSSDLIDASADRWAPRPYPLSTRPLYLTSPPPEGEEQLWDVPLPQPKKRRNEAEAEVEFEMPVSLDQLDERVAVGAQKAVNRKVGKLKMPKKRPPKPVINSEDENAGTRYQKRGVPGRICQGCAGEGLKVWRRGPGGPGTLCNTCGSKYLDGTLGPLLAPAATVEPPSASAVSDEAGDAPQDVKMEVGQPYIATGGPTGVPAVEAEQQPIDPISAPAEEIRIAPIAPAEPPVQAATLVEAPQAPREGFTIEPRPDSSTSIAGTQPTPTAKQQ